MCEKKETRLKGQDHAAVPVKYERTSKPQKDFIENVEERDV